MAPLATERKPQFYLAVLLLVIQLALARIVPPHPDFVDFEPVADMRRRLGVSYNYTPQFLDAEECRYLTEESCREKDNRRANRHLNPSVGDRLRVIVLLIKFKDHANMAVPPRTYYEEMFNGNGKSDVNEVGSIKEWLRYNSLGKYRVHFDVRDWEVAPETESSYAAGVSGQGVDLERMFSFALNKIDSSIDWFDGYVDEFGYMNHLVVLHSGYVAEAGDRPCLSGSYRNRIWSSGGGGGGPDSWLSKDYFQLSGYMITSAWGIPVCDKNNKSLLKPVGPTKMNIISHEYCHGFGLPDLYDKNKGAKSLGGTGKFGTMSSSVGWDVKGSTPGHLNAFVRQKLGWVKPIVIDKDGFYAVQPLEISSHIYRIDHGFPDGEYLLIELKLSIKWDSDVPKGGIVIYHVDEKAPMQEWRGYPGHPQWPAYHYTVAVQQADRLYEIEKGVNGGDEGDFWVKNMKIVSGGSYPNTDAYQGGKVRSTGIVIEILSDPGLIMVFKVSGIGSRNSNLPSATETKQSLRGQRDTTGEALQWVLSMLAGLGLMLGLLVVVL